MIHEHVLDEMLLRRRDVERLVGLKKSAIYLLMSEGLFPRPVRVGKRCVAWRSSDLKKWISNRPGGGGFDFP